jgi:hypothetical protein
MARNPARGMRAPETIGPPALLDTRELIAKLRLK